MSALIPNWPVVPRPRSATVRPLAVMLRETMKNKIPYLTEIALTAWLLAGCQKPPAGESPSAANPPSAQPNTNSNTSTNLSQANPPVSTNQ